MQELSKNPQIRLWLFIGFLATLGGLSYLVLFPFLAPVAWAMILAYASWPLYQKLLKRLKHKTGVAAVLMTLGMMIAIVIPMFWLLYTLKVELTHAVSVMNTQFNSGALKLPNFIQDLPVFGNEIAARFTQIMAEPDQFKIQTQNLLSQANKEAISLLGDIGRNFAKMGIALLTLYFLYKDGASFFNQIQRVLNSLLGSRVQGYLAAAGGATRGVVYGILLTAIVQGLVAGLGYWVAGLDAPIMLASVTVLFALIPFGTPLVWGSIGLWLLFTGETWAGIGLLIWGTLVVSWVDNIIRPLMVSQNVRLPFILAFFGVLGGLAAFGLVGLFIGPVVLAVAYSVWVEWLEAYADQPSA
jgi:predicted PurR-regulated permease PerM